MRILTSGGGTGGHVYPALAVLKTLDAETEWVGSIGGIEEELVRRAGLRFAGIPAGGLRGVAPWVALRNLGRLAAGYRRAEGLVAEFQPNAVFATGGYVCVPVVLAARRRGIPSLLYLPDIVPGLAIQTLAQMVDRVAASFDVSRAYLPADKIVITGYPVRQDLLQADKASARARLGLSPDSPVLLVFGGSRGARRLNEAAADAMTELARLAQVIHVTGTRDADWVGAHRAALLQAGTAGESSFEHLEQRYRVYPYLHSEMADALTAADLGVTRAGAATLGELPAAGLPAILVPYPHSGQHQMPNARYLADRGAAIIVQDADLTGARLLGEVRALLSDPGRLAAMSAAARRLSVPDAADRIAAELRALARGPGRV